MTTIGAILLGVVFCSPLVVIIWAAAAMAGKADEDMGIKSKVRR